MYILTKANIRLALYQWYYSICTGYLGMHATVWNIWHYGM